jgi:hypothetical protein
MDCEKVRDRFSSLWEKELTPFDEKGIKEHLSSCPECQREFEQFEKTMRWLHSVGEVEVPDEFLPGLYKKMEERKSIRSAEKSRKGWFNFPLPLKLPVQAAAMVAVVFLVLYLTKMMPLGEYRPRETGQPHSPLSVGKKSEQTLAQKELERGRGTLPAEAPRPKDVEQAKAILPEEKKFEPTTQQAKAETKRTEAPSPKSEVLAFKKIESKEAAKAAAPSPEPERIEKEWVVKRKSVAAKKPRQEIVLKISDREKGIFQVRELVKQFKGEIVATEENGLLASLPAGSFSEFKKELVGVSSTGQADKVIMRKQTTGDLRGPQEAEKEAIGEKRREPEKVATDEEGRIVVRILLVQE